MRKSHLLAGAAASLAITALALPAAAQSVDYGSLQALFNEPVTTSATGSPQRSTEAPADMQIISADEIRRSGEISIPGILQRVAGVDVLNFSAGHSDVTIRGYDQVSSPRLLVLVNGRQVYLDHYGMTVWATIPVELDEIRQIEVVKGPSSALFGFNAVSGVINIITYNPKFDDTNVATLRGGSQGLVQGSLVKTLKLGDAFSARLSVGGQSQNEWKISGPLPTKDQLHDPQSARANLDVVGQLAAKTELRLEGSWSNIQEDVLAGSGYAVIKMVNTSEKATLTSDTDYGTIQAQVYQNQLRSKYDLSTSALGWNNTITVASLQDLFKVGANHTFRLDAEYRHNTLNTAPAQGGDVSYDVASAAGMWNWQVTKQLTTTAALRLDKMTLGRSGPFLPREPRADNGLWDNREITTTSANVTVAWRPTDADTFRLSYGRGIQAPSLIDLGALEFPVAVAPGFTLDIVGNPFLRPTVVSNYELAYDHEFAPVKAKVGVRLFNQTLKDLKGNISTAGLDLFPTATTNAAVFISNGSNSRMNGAEVTASGRLTPTLGWRADYTYTDVRDSVFKGVNAVATSLAFAQTTPKSRGNVGLDWEQGPWEADANLHYVDDFQFYDIANGALKPVKAYGSLSARVGYKMANGLVVAVSGQDLLKDQQQQTRGLQAERRVLFSLSKAW